MSEFAESIFGLKLVFLKKYTYKKIILSIFYLCKHLKDNKYFCSLIFKNSEWIFLLWLRHPYFINTLKIKMNRVVMTIQLKRNIIKESACMLR